MTARPLYLTGVTSTAIEAELAADPRVGLLVQPGNSYTARLDRWATWAADSGAFGWWKCQRSGAWTKQASCSLRQLWEAWLEWLDSIDPAHRPRCRWVAVPDAIQVAGNACHQGGAELTLDWYRGFVQEVRAMGYRPALVAQDGLEAPPPWCSTRLLDFVPWRDVGAVFLGGSTAWKLDPAGAGVVAAEAVRRGVPVHMGRVNSLLRLQLAGSWGCDSVDGTYLAFGPRRNVPRLRRWLDAMEGGAV